MAEEKKPAKKRGGKRENFTPRATDAEIELRVGKVVEMLIEGYTPQEIAKYGKEKWPVRQSGIEAYIRKANVKIKESITAERDEFLARKLLQLDQIARKATNAEQYSAAQSCLKLQADLARLVDK